MGSWLLSSAGVRFWVRFVVYFGGGLVMSEICRACHKEKKFKAFDLGSEKCKATEGLCKKCFVSLRNGVMRKQWAKAKSEPKSLE